MWTRGMRGRRLRVVAALAVSGLLLTACGDGDGDGDPAGDGEGQATSDGEVDPADLDEVTITWPGGVGEDHWSSAGVRSWAQEIEERSDGRIQFDIHWAGSLGPLEEHSVMLQDGVADVGEIYPAYEPSAVPVANWITNLAWSHEPRPLFGDLQAYGASVELGFSDAATAEFEDMGLVPLIPNIQALSTYGLICREPITSLDDADGVPVRVPGDVVGAEAEAVGFAPTQIPGPEAYEALQRGVVECTVAHPRDVTAYGYHEVAPHVTLGTEGGFSGFMGQGVYANQAFWDSLQPEARQILWESIPAFVEGQMRAALEEDAEALSMTESVNEYDEEFEQTLIEHQEATREAMPESAPDRLSAQEAQQVVDDAIGIYDDWAGLLDEAGYGEWPDQWEEHGPTIEEEGLDLEPWVDAFTERVLEPNRPE